MPVEHLPVHVKAGSHDAICIMRLFCTVDLFMMSSCIATRWLVHNGGYIQKLLQLSNSSEILWFGNFTLYLRFYRILIMIDFTVFWQQYSIKNFGNPPLWTSLWRFLKGSIMLKQKRKITNQWNWKELCKLIAPCERAFTCNENDQRTAIMIVACADKVWFPSDRNAIMKSCNPSTF